MQMSNIEKVLRVTVHQVGVIYSLEWSTLKLEDGIPFCICHTLSGKNHCNPICSRNIIPPGISVGPVCESCLDLSGILSLSPEPLQLQVKLLGSVFTSLVISQCLYGLSSLVLHQCLVLPECFQCLVLGLHEVNAHKG